MNFTVYRYQKNNGWAYTLDAEHPGNFVPAGTFTTVGGKIAELCDDKLVRIKFLLIGGEVVTADEIVTGKAEQHGIYISATEVKVKALVLLSIIALAIGLSIILMYAFCQGIIHVDTERFQKNLIKNTEKNFKRVGPAGEAWLFIYRALKPILGLSPGLLAYSPAWQSFKKIIVKIYNLQTASVTLRN